ncbi:MAG: hypothetical protein Q4E61_00435 [Alphaproteobacteria bacterium]|nr:hypothetical protein [Alphaproteobacteria bacterium]
MIVLLYLGFLNCLLASETLDLNLLSIDSLLNNLHSDIKSVEAKSKVNSVPRLLPMIMNVKIAKANFIESIRERYSFLTSYVIENIINIFPNRFDFSRLNELYKIIYNRPNDLVVSTMDFERAPINSDGEILYNQFFGKKPNVPSSIHFIKALSKLDPFILKITELQKQKYCFLWNFRIMVEIF